MKSKRKWLNRNVASFGLASLFSDTSHEMATAILPLFLSVELGTAALILGIIEGVSDITSSFTKTASGWYSDKLGKRKPFIALGYLLTGIFMPVIGAATNWIHVLLARTAGWMGRGIRGPPRDALLSESVDKRSRSHAFGFERSLDTVGAIIGPAIAFIALPALGFRNILLLSLLPGVMAFFMILFVRERKRRKPKRKLQFGKTVKDMPHSFKKFLLAAGIFGIANFANTFLVLRAMEALQPSMGTLAAGSIATGLYVGLNVGAAIFAYVFGAIGDRTNKKYLIALGYILFSAYCIGFILLQPTLLNLLLMFMLAGVETGLIDVMERAYTADLLKSDVRGTGYGLLNTVNGIGDFISSVSAGMLWTAFSFAFAFGFSAILGIAATLVLVFAIRG